MSLIVAVLGASTLLGQTLVGLLDKRQFPLTDLLLIDMELTDTAYLVFQSYSKPIKLAESTHWERVDWVFNCQPDPLPEVLLTQCQTGRTRIIDLSPAVAHEYEVLVAGIERQGASYPIECYWVAAHPAVVGVSLALADFHTQNPLLRLNLVSLTSVAEAGEKGVHALASETANLLNAQEPEEYYFEQPVAFNVLSSVGNMLESKASSDENSITQQLRAVLADEQIELVVSSLRAPLFYGHYVIVHAECQYPVDLKALQASLIQKPGVLIVDDSKYSILKDPDNQDVVIVTRLRQEQGNPAGFILLIMVDSLHKGGALNAIECVEQMIAQLDQ